MMLVNVPLCLCDAQVFPKMLDTFLLALYASMVPVVYLQFSWLQDWINVYHYGAVAAFVWVSAWATGLMIRAAGLSTRHSSCKQVVQTAVALFEQLYGTGETQGAPHRLFLCKPAQKPVLLLMFMLSCSCQSCFRVGTALPQRV
jgi:hypothetical protein